MKRILGTVVALGVVAIILFAALHAGNYSSMIQWEGDSTPTPQEEPQIETQIEPCDSLTSTPENLGGEAVPEINSLD